jgi:hypothetical protein
VKADEREENFLDGINRMTKMADDEGIFRIVVSAKIKIEDDRARISEEYGRPFVSLNLD